MNYKITKQFPNQQQVDCARFVNEVDAKVSLQALFANDYMHKTNVVYRLFDKYGDEVAQLDTNKDTPSTAAAGAQSAGESASAAGSGQTSGFRPTPFSTTPTPPGGPKKWTTDPEDEDKK